VNAIPDGPPTDEVFNRSNLVGVRKWTVDAEPCFRFWVNQNSDCSICVRVCPYSRDFSTVWARSWRWLAGTRFRRVALWLADVFAPGSRVNPESWWREGAKRV
jgi:ferredoxin